MEQYGQYGMAQPGMLPYPITLARPADRVTEEDAAVTVLDPASPILNTPNRIGPADFDHWVQERVVVHAAHVRQPLSRDPVDA